MSVSFLIRHGDIHRFCYLTGEVLKVGIMSLDSPHPQSIKIAPWDSVFFPPAAGFLLSYLFTWDPSPIFSQMTSLILAQARTRFSLG